MKNQLMPSIWRQRNKALARMVPAGLIFAVLLIALRVEFYVLPKMPNGIGPQSILGWGILYLIITTILLVIAFSIYRKLLVRRIRRSKKPWRAFRTAQTVLPLLWNWKKRKRIIDRLGELQKTGANDVTQHYIREHSFADSSLAKVIDHLYLEETLDIWSKYYLRHTHDVSDDEVIKHMSESKSLSELYTRCLLAVFSCYDVTKGTFNTFWNEVLSKDEISADLLKEMVSYPALRSFAKKMVTERHASPFLSKKLEKIRADYKNAQYGDDKVFIKRLNHELMALYWSCHEWELEDLRLYCLSEVNFKINKLFKAEREGGNPPLSDMNRLLILRENNF